MMTNVQKAMIAVIGLSILSLAACGQLGRNVANVTGHSESCIDGVKYVQFSSGASVKYNKDGSIQTCN